MMQPSKVSTTGGAMRRILTLCVLVALAGLLAGPVEAPAEARPEARTVKPGSFFVVACPAGQLGVGGQVSYYDKRQVLIGTQAGVAAGGGVRFGPAPKKAELAVVTSLVCQPPATTTTVAATTTTSTTLPPTTTTSTTLPPPTTTTSTTTTTTLPPDPNVYLTGTVTVTDQGYIVYAPAADNIPGAVSCPTGTRLDFAASTFSNPTEVTVQFFPTFNWIIATTIDEPTPAEPTVERELTFRIVCRPE
jgi:hypothetical protein